MSATIKLTSIKELMHHDNGECCGFYGYKIDENQGLRSQLKFKENQISQTDYFLIQPKTNKAQFIEFTSLTDDIRDCLIAEIILEGDLDSYATLLRKKPNKAKKIVQRKIWAEVVAEFKNKWMGSIAILERYCRETEIRGYLDYQMLIVLDSTTDPRELDILASKLVGMVGKLPVCNSNTVTDLLLVKLLQPSILLINFNANIPYSNRPFSLSSTKFIRHSDKK